MSLDDGYTTTPNKLRILKDEDNDFPWQLDGIDTRETFRGADGRPKPTYTEMMWNFQTFSDAVLAMPTFVAELFMRHDIRIFDFPDQDNPLWKYIGDYTRSNP